MSGESSWKKFDFAWVKNEVTKTLDGESSLLWSSLAKWLDDDGEATLKKNIEISVDALKSDGLSMISKLKSKIPLEEQV